jgi:phosphate transport system permease protein
MSSADPAPAPATRGRLSHMLSEAADTGYRAFGVKAGQVLGCVVVADLLLAGVLRWIGLPAGMGPLAFLAVCGLFGAAMPAIFQRGSDGSARGASALVNAVFFALTAAVLFALCPDNASLAIGMAFHALGLALLLPLGFNVSRPLTTRAFSLFAFLSTFSGLLMLVVFFASIGVKVAHWFRAMPALVVEENRHLLDKAENRYKEEVQSLQERVLKDFRDEVKQFGKDPAKWPEGPRQEYQDVIGGEMEKLKKNAEEWRKEADLLVRPEPTPAHLITHFVAEKPGDKESQAGIMPALLGSLYIGLLTIVFALPLGVGAAIFLEEYQQNSRLARFIQVNINNLAGVPSIIYGILGAAIFVDAISKPLHSRYHWIADRNLLAGGLTLALLTLPVVIVSAQEAIRAVPSSLRHASLALGATRWQTIWRVVLPAATPGILTGLILSVSRAMGEAAPLVMFGAILYTSDAPTPFDRFAVMPLQIYAWTQKPEEAWRDNAAMASAVLVGMVLLLNGVAIWYRHRMAKKLRW